MFFLVGLEWGFCLGSFDYVGVWLFWFFVRRGVSLRDVFEY